MARIAKSIITGMVTIPTPVPPAPVRIIGVELERTIPQGIISEVFEQTHSTAVTTLTVTGVARNAVILNGTSQTATLTPVVSTVSVYTFATNTTAFTIPATSGFFRITVDEPTGEVKIRPTNVTARIATEAGAGQLEDNSIILLSNGPHGGFTQEAVLPTGVPYEVNDVVRALITDQ